MFAPLRFTKVKQKNGNMKTEYGMDYFRADQCITKLETENTAEILGGVTYKFPAYFGYE